MVPTLETVDVSDETRDPTGQPPAHFDVLREQAPVFWYRSPGVEPFWAVTRHEDVTHVSRHPELFSGAQRVTVDPNRAIEMNEADVDQRAAMVGHGREDAPARSHADAARHRELRRVTATFFSAEAVSGLEDRLTELARGYADDFSRRLDLDGVADLAKHLTCRLPVAAICEVVGIPEADHDAVLAWTEGIVGCADPGQQLDGEDAHATFTRSKRDLHAYLEQHVAAGMESGGDGMLGRLVATPLAGGPLARDEVLYTVQNLLVAGNGTTRNAMAGGVEALLRHPDQLQALADDESLVDGAVEEVLRWTTMAVHVARTCLQDTELGGQRIRAGETVVMWHPAADCDPEAFEDPYRFDITREPDPHDASEGPGARTCPGQHLTRLEMRATLRATLPLLRGIELIGRPEPIVLHLPLAELKRLLVRRQEITA